MTGIPWNTEQFKNEFKLLATKITCQTYGEYGESFWMTIKNKHLNGFFTNKHVLLPDNENQQLFLTFQKITEFGCYDMQSHYDKWDI